NGKSSINKFDVHPIHQQRSISELDDGAKALLRKSPPAPRVNKKKYDQQNAAAHQQKIRAAVPVVVDRVQPRVRRIEQNRQSAGENSRAADGREGQSFLALRKVRKQK